MKIEIRVPSMGESVTEATIGTILKPSGSWVERDEEICELETDKVNQLLYAPSAGQIQLHVKTDESVAIGQTIGVIDTEAIRVSQDNGPEKKIQEPEKKALLKETKPLSSKKKERPEEKKTELKEPTLQERAAPEIKKVGREESRRKMSKIRKVIAQRMLESKLQTAMLTTFNEVDMSAIMDLRARYKEAFTSQHGSRLGLMSFFVKAVVVALKAFPLLNAYLDGDEIVQRHYYDIGIAVGTEKGLIVPVIRHCNELNFAEIEMTLEQYADKARKGTLSVEELQGAGFTITNGGVYGSLLSTPILVPPQTGILGMHKIEKRAVVVNDQIVIRPMMYLALSYDHRLIDGKEAVGFLVNMKNTLEDPSRLLLDI